MSTTVKQIEDKARKLLDDEGGEEEWKNKTDIYPWLHQGRTELRSVRQETALASDGATVTTLTELTAKTDVITEPDRFALCLAYYVAAMCLSCPSGDRKEEGKAGKFFAQFKFLAATM